jgi:guanylate kinase
MVHISLAGFGGAGKTTISRLLSAKHRTLWIPRLTTRAPRFGENLRGEYEFISQQEFDRRLENDLLLSNTPHLEEETGEFYYTGIPNPLSWPQPTKDIELVLSVFGSGAPKAKKESLWYRPKMKTILIIAKQEELDRRLSSRAKYSQHQKLNRVYEKMRIWENYDVVVLNNGTPEKCVKTIEHLVGLASKPHLYLV